MYVTEKEAHSDGLVFLEVLYWLSSWVSDPECELPWILLDVSYLHGLYNKDFPFLGGIWSLKIINLRKKYCLSSSSREIRKRYRH